MSSSDETDIITKEEFGRRVYALMLQKGWRQADLARAADIPRDSISSYVRGLALPSSMNAKKLADAFGVESQELLPNTNYTAIRDHRSSFEFKVSQANPTRAWIKLDREVDFDVAVKIAALLNARS